MSENHPDGYLKHQRKTIGKRDPKERVKDNDEVWNPEWDEQHLREQGERCMDCGIPTCMGGCPIGNIIPDWNDLVYRSDWKKALERLHATNNFPEFTGYCCPAPCEDACTLNINNNPVTIKSIERAIVDRGWEEGWIQPQPPETRTDYHVAVVGSGPAGLSAAQQLNRAGHNLTVYERDDEIGGLMKYGIPEFKFTREKVDRRVNQLNEEGINFQTGVEIGADKSLEQLRTDFDAVCLTVGSQDPHDLQLPGRDLDGIHFAMDYLKGENKRQAGKTPDSDIHADGKNVVVLGGGDTGADCVATAHRQGSNQVTQIELIPRPPESVSPESNPWPETPHLYNKSYAQKEGGEEEYSINTNAFLDLEGNGRVDHLDAERVLWNYDEEGNLVDRETIQSDLRIPAELVIMAIGFSGPQTVPFKDTGLDVSKEGLIESDESLQTNLEGVFAAGDARRGPTIIVWAIGEGRDVACHIDRYLTGETNLPRSLQTENPPINQ